MADNSPHILASLSRYGPRRALSLVHREPAGDVLRGDAAAAAHGRCTSARASQTLAIRSTIGSTIPRSGTGSSIPRTAIAYSTRRARRCEAAKSVDFEYRVICTRRQRHVGPRPKLLYQGSRMASRSAGRASSSTSPSDDLTEQELEKREKLYRTLARTIPETAVAALRPRIPIHARRRRAAQESQMVTGDVRGQDALRGFPEDVCREWADYYRRALNGEDHLVRNENDGRRLPGQCAAGS